MNEDKRGFWLQASPALREAVEELVQQGMDQLAATRRLAETRPELFTTPADEIVRMLATWD